MKKISLSLAVVFSAIVLSLSSATAAPDRNSDEWQFTLAPLYLLPCLI